MQLFRRSDQVDFLRKIPLFSDLSQRDLALIAKNLDEVELDAGNVLAQEGRLGMEFIIILSGRAQVHKRGKVVGHLSDGDFFGEVSLIDQGLRTATVTSETPMRLMVMHARSFRPLLDSIPGLAKKMVYALCAYLRAAEEELAKLR